ncbi:hypothetical protein K1719_045176 [Acacia pycnantha]|nr:hypothetical protein K1719_045176 [Acacia pycnantha]
MIQRCGDGLLSPNCCIYRVPTALRALNKEAYTPQIVSIGPFHHGNGNKRLQNMEMHKQILFKRFTQRAMSSCQEDLVKDLVAFVKDLEPKVRACYSEKITLTTGKLVKLILIDAGFIIELFTSNGNFSQQWLEDSIRDDLLLIENQLPFFVIKELYNKAFPQYHDGRSGYSFLKLTYDYFDCYNCQKLKPNAHVKIKHFTDLLRLFYLRKEMHQHGMTCTHEEMPQRDNSSIEEGRHILLYNANALQEAGIKLKASKSKCLLDLKFSGHILEIPQILVEDGTEVVFRNMIALEHCHYPDDAYITNYALILDRLIDTSKDVDLLIDGKIVRHYLGDRHNVASFFNGLCKNVVQTNFNPKYVDICEGLNKYCENLWHKKVATLRRDYCNTAWRTVASVGGIILLVLTIVQTIFSVLQVVLK